MRVTCFDKNTYTSFKAIYSKEEQQRFMAMAEEESKKSKCQRNKAGANVVSKDGICYVAHNAPPSGITNPCEVSGECPRIKYNVTSGTLHDCTHQNVDAEAGAILKAGFKESSGGTLFLYGHYHLCDSCKRIAVAANINDFYIQSSPKDVIKHFSLSEIIREMNANFQVSYLDFLKTMGKRI